MRWSFYDLTTGEFTGRQFSSPYAKDLLIPDGYGAKEGSHDPLLFRVDLKTKEVVEWVNEDRKVAIEKAEQVSGAVARIAELEQKQLRAMRENVLRPSDTDPDGKSARERLAAIDDEIAALREVISDGKDTSEP